MKIQKNVTLWSVRGSVPFSFIFVHILQKSTCYSRSGASSDVNSVASFRALKLLSEIRFHRPANGEGGRFDFFMPNGQVRSQAPYDE